jgi:hypothetical protein
VTVKLDAKAALASFGLRGSKHGWKKIKFWASEKKQKCPKKTFLKVDTKVFLFANGQRRKPKTKD